jgi:hypothetical protein
MLKKWIISVLMIIGSMNILVAQDNGQAIKITNAMVVNNETLNISFEIQNNSESNLYLLLHILSEKTYIDNELFCIEFMEDQNLLLELPTYHITRFPSSTLIPSQSTYIYTSEREYFPGNRYDFSSITDLKILVLLFPFDIGVFLSFDEYIKTINELGEELELVCPLLVIQQTGE